MCAAKRQTASAVFPIVHLFEPQPRAAALEVPPTARTYWGDAAFAYSEQLEYVEVWSPEGGDDVILGTYLGTPPDRDPVFAQLLQVLSRKRGVFVGYVDCLREALRQMAHLQEVLSGSGPAPSMQTNRKILELAAGFLWAATMSRLLRDNSACVARIESEFGRADAILEHVYDLVLEAGRKSDIPRALMSRLQEQSIDPSELVPTGQYHGLAWVKFLLCCRQVCDSVAIASASGIARDPAGMLACLRSLDLVTLEEELQAAREREFLDGSEVASKNGKASGRQSSRKKREWWDQHGPEIEQRLNGRAQTTEGEFWEELAKGGEFIDQKTGESKSASTLRKDYAAWLKLRDAPTHRDTAAN
jgi:hypothetical protein